MLKTMYFVTRINPLYRRSYTLVNKIKIHRRSFTTDVSNFAQTESKENNTEEIQSERTHRNPFGVPKSKLQVAHSEVEALNDESYEQAVAQEYKQNESNAGRNPFASRNVATNNFSSSADLTDEERERRLKILKLEVDIANQEGRRVPSLDFFKDQHWEHVLSLPSKSARIRYYAYLWQIEIKIESQLRKKQERAEQIRIRKEELQRQNEQNNHIIYGLNHVSFFLRIYDTTMNNFYNNRLVQAMRFSSKIVMDCSYDEYMTKREAINAAKQLMITFAENRLHDEPFDLHFCNVNMNSDCMQSLYRHIPTMLNVDFPMNVHQKCFTELFPKENLVYLTPHCRNDLVDYNHDDIYIIGAMVDTHNNEPLSLAKAKKMGLRMARLPLDHYLQWGAGSGKSLTLNQMISIMLDIKKTGDWMKALSHVPRRKLVEMQAQQSRQFLDKRAKRLNIKLDNVFEDDDEDTNSYTSKSSNVRSYKNNLQFNLDTWGSKKNNRRY